MRDTERPAALFQDRSVADEKIGQNQLDAGGVKLLPGYRLALFGSNDIIERFRPIKIIHRPLGDDGDIRQVVLVQSTCLPRDHPIKSESLTSKPSLHRNLLLRKNPIIRAADCVL